MQGVILCTDEVGWNITVNLILSLNISKPAISSSWNSKTRHEWQRESHFKW